MNDGHQPSPELWTLVQRVVATLPLAHRRSLAGVVIQEWATNDPTMQGRHADAGFGTIRFRSDFMQRADREAVVVHECMHILNDDTTFIAQNPHATKLVEELADLGAAELGYYVRR